MSSKTQQPGKQMLAGLFRLNLPATAASGATLSAAVATAATAGSATTATAAAIAA
ncbi:MAG: hypothetical protein H7Y17_09475, partial [Chlorobia bacterium]|nr:hypothetical protein [Fimbriimonadaceae bacterium]